MNYIGEFQKDSTILLELLTKDEENQPIPTDYPPTARIEQYDRNGIVEVDNVTLETMEDGSRHAKNYEIPDTFQYGDYWITYSVSIDGIIYTSQESFTLKEAITTPTVPVEDEIVEEPVKSAEGYIMPPEFQSTSIIEVVGNQIIITMSDNALYNRTHQVVLGNGIKSVSGNKLTSAKTITYTTAYGPLLATPLEVSSILRSMYKYFTPHDIYLAIRNASQRIYQMKVLTPDMNSSRFRAIRETDTTYFATTKFATYEAARMLLAKLIIRILNGADETGDDPTGGGGLIDDMGGSMTLGDFSVTDSSSTNTAFGSTADTKEEETPLEKLQAFMAQVEKEMRFWQDAMMGQNGRGYAKPVSSSFRTAAGSPTGRDFT